jgi:hypothetical protein
MEQNKVQVVIKTIMDLITIIVPAVIAALGAYGLTTAAENANKLQEILMICLGAASTSASLIYS